MTAIVRLTAEDKTPPGLTATFTNVAIQRETFLFPRAEMYFAGGFARGGAGAAAGREGGGRGCRLVSPLGQLDSGAHLDTKWTMLGFCSE